MTLVSQSVLVVIVVASIVPVLGFQGQDLGPGRVGGPPQTATQRRIPIGAASVSGLVTAADTGRPMRGARVTVFGTIPISSNQSQSVVAPGGTASVMLTMSAGQIQSVSRSAQTDEQGAFVIDNLPGGQYRLNVSALRTPYLSTTYGQKRPGGNGSLFTVTDGQRVKVNVQMPRGGVITGTVYGEDGGPLTNARVQGWLVTASTGIRRLQTTASVVTDDRGVFRIFGLEPGEYLVGATPDASTVTMASSVENDAALIARAIAAGAVTAPTAPGQPSFVSVPVPTAQEQMDARQNERPAPTFLPVYYPNTPVRGQAEMIRVTGGDEHPNTDIRVVQTRASTVQGTIRNMPTEDVGVQVMLTSNDPLGDGPAIARVDASGRFSFRSVGPGRYTVDAAVTPQSARPQVSATGQYTAPGPPPPLTDAQRWYAHAVIDVQSESANNISVSLSPGRLISGRVVFDMSRPPDLSRGTIRVALTPAAGRPSPGVPPPQGELRPDGQFTIAGVGPGTYSLRIPVSTTRSAIVDGKDVLDFPFDFVADRDVTDAVITVTDRVTDLSGVATDALGNPAAGYTIIAAATDQRFWTPQSRRIAIASLLSNGQYRFRALPPGEYLLAAVNDLGPGGQYDPAFLKTVAAAAIMRITLAENTPVVQNIRIVR